MWLECCQTERGQQWYDDVLCGGARVEQEAVPGTHMTVPARVGRVLSVCSAWRTGWAVIPGDPMGLGGAGRAQRGSGEIQWQLPRQLPAPHDSKEQKERKALGSCGVGPLSSACACACALQILCGACALRVLCGKPRLLPAPFPSCSQPSWYPVAIATLWLPALAGGAAGEDGRVDWPPVGGVGSSSAVGQDAGIPPPCCRAPGTT